MSVSKIYRLYSPHRIAAKPPNSRKAPEKAQVMSEYISFGVIASWHCSGLAAKGTMKPNYNGQLLCLILGIGRYTCKKHIATTSPIVR